jgi:hypothetical protein
MTLAARVVLALLIAAIAVALGLAAHPLFFLILLAIIVLVLI